ncbi:TPA: hypothetical protein DEP94_03015 [Candidatus Nomurabacteria bacterium]|nr:hypothetical protein [Candidatus Nomurabacteria bacterium]
MTPPSTIPYTIAVIRGGKVNTSQSLKDGKDILVSLTGIGYTPLDILVDTDGSWTMKGRPTDAHYVFTIAESVVDTTQDVEAPWRELAKKMWIPLLLSHDDSVTLDREDMYRLFRQHGLPTPKTLVVRANTETPRETFRELWQTFHTPLMVRPLKKDKENESVLIRKYADLENVLADYHNNNLDVHIFTYKPTRTLSVAVLPNFRGQKLYTPLAVETFSPVTALPRKDHPMRAVFKAGEKENDAIRKAAESAYQSLGINGHASIDMIPYKDGYMVINVDLKPSLSKDGRFAQSLATTGVDVGQYVHSLVSKDF